MQLANVRNSLGTISVATGGPGRREGIDREALVTMGGGRNGGARQLPDVQVSFEIERGTGIICKGTKRGDVYRQIGLASRFKL